MFRDAATQDNNINLEEYTTSVTSYISKCADDVVITKTVRSFPNRKAWMNGEVRALSRAKKAAFRSGDKEAYNTARARLKAGIKEAKRRHQQRLERDLSMNNTKDMWQAIQQVTGYKSRSAPLVCEATLPDELNTFYARFDLLNKESAVKSIPPPEDRALSVTSADVRKILLRVNTNKAAGPDNIPGRVLKTCANQLADVITDIFNISLSQETVPTCFKTATIIPVPKKSAVSALNDYRPVALTPILMKCFEKLVLQHIKVNIPANLDPHQYAFRTNRSTEDAISTALHSVFTHLENKNSYVRMLFVDFSSAFNTISPMKLIEKLKSLGLSITLCNWIMDFLTNRPQTVRIGNHTSSMLVLNTGAPQGCVLSPLLFTLYTHDCTPRHPENSIVKYADDTTIIGRIINNDESSYREEINNLAEWCTENNLLLNVSKTKELIVDFRKKEAKTHTPVYIGGAEVEQVDSFRFLGINIAENLSWSPHITTLVKKAQKRLYFLRKLKKAKFQSQTLISFYRGAIESILTGNITIWHGSCTVQDRKALQRVIKTSQNIIGTRLQSISDIGEVRCLRRAKRILKDNTHPSHSLFTLLPSGRRYRSIRCCTTRLQSSFFLQAVRSLNSSLYTELHPPM